MNYRKEAFTRKFNSAAKFLGVRADQILSLKFRENVGSYDDYRELVDRLRDEAAIQYSEVDGDIQGRGYLLSIKNATVLLVEHETGLEILYIASSIASLLGLVPMVLQGWAVIRRRLPQHDALIDGPVEVRRIDQTGNLQEEHLHAHQISTSLLHIGSFAPVVTASATFIEDEMRSLTRKVEELSFRIDAVEKLAGRKSSTKVQALSRQRASGSRTKKSARTPRKKP